MQLVEQGKIDLDADVNTYLDFKISTAQWQAGHNAQHHDAYVRLRGNRSPPHP
jgi:CubicO group peptidase (beta-lactamase class C family)